MGAQRKEFDLNLMCAALEVSPSGYRAWKRGGTPSRKRLTDAQMVALIRAIDAELKGAYGSPRMVLELRARGFPAGKERVERLMRENGIHGRHKRRYKVTTNSKHGLPVRNFTLSAPNQVWTSNQLFHGISLNHLMAGRMVSIKFILTNCDIHEVDRH